MIPSPQKPGVGNLLWRSGGVSLDPIRGVGHFYAIDLLRGLSALVILLWHYWHFYWPPVGTNATTWPPLPLFDRTTQPLYGLFFPFYKFGLWAVQFFWLLSGFVFAHVYAGRSTTAKDFTVSRFARLYPLHFITLLAAGLLQGLSWKLTGAEQLARYNNGSNFVLNLLFLSGWGIGKGTGFNTPIWSVSLEIFAYCLFFFVARRIYAAGVVRPALLCLLSLVGVVLGNYTVNIFSLCTYHFFLGVLSYYAVAVLRKRVGLAVALSLGMLVVFAKLATFGRIMYTPLFYVAQTFLFVPVLLLAALIDLRAAPLSGLKKVKWIGDATYSIYLWHFPLQILVVTLLAYYSVDRAVFNRPVTLLSWLSLMLVIGVLSFHYIERPLQKLVLKAFKKGPKKPEADRLQPASPLP